MDRENGIVCNDAISRYAGLAALVVFVVVTLVVLFTCLPLGNNGSVCCCKKEEEEEFEADKGTTGEKQQQEHKNCDHVVYPGNVRREVEKQGRSDDVDSSSSSSSSLLTLSGMWNGKFLAVFGQAEANKRPSAFELAFGSGFQLAGHLRLYPCTVHSPAFLSPPVAVIGTDSVLVRFRPNREPGAEEHEITLRPVVAPFELSDTDDLQTSFPRLVVEGPDGILFMSGTDVGATLFLAAPTAEGVVVLSTPSSAQRRLEFSSTHLELYGDGGEDPFLWYKEYQEGGERVVVHYKPTVRNPEPRFLADVDRYLPRAIRFLTGKLGLSLCPLMGGDAGAEAAVDIYLVRTSDRWGKANVSTGAEPRDRPFILDPGTYAYAQGTELDQTTSDRLLDYRDMYVVCGSGEDAHDPVDSGALAGSSLVHELVHVAQMKLGFPLYLLAGESVPRARSWAPWCSEGPAVLGELLLAYDLLHESPGEKEVKDAYDLAKVVLHDYVMVAAWEAHLPFAVPEGGMNAYGTFFVHLYWALRTTEAYLPSLIRGGARLLTDLRVDPEQPGFVSSGGVPLLDPVTLRPVFRHGQDSDLMRRAFVEAAWGGDKMTWEESDASEAPERCVHAAVTALLLEGLQHPAFCPPTGGGEIRDPFGIGRMLGYYFLLVATMFRDHFTVGPEGEHHPSWTSPGPAAAGGGSVFRQLLGVPAGAELRQRTSSEDEESALLSLVFLDATGQLLGSGGETVPCVVPQGTANVYMAATALRHSGKGTISLELSPAV